MNPLKQNIFLYESTFIDVIFISNVKWPLYVISHSECIEIALSYYCEYRL